MAVDAATLDIKVRSTDVGRARDALGRFVKVSKDAERATGRLTTSTKSFGSVVKSAVAPVLALVSAYQGLTKLVGVSREFEVLNAQLVTATGSAEGATEAFAAIEDFATRTPFQLGEVVTSFTKLVNLGLKPSERALVSYGDTASAMGKSLDQMIEAVADAATGEFERLKEFGIKGQKPR